MVSEKVTIVNTVGLHARPAAEFVKLATSFSSDITLCRHGSDDKVNAKSMILVLSQGFTHGTELVIAASGEDEETALRALVDFIASGCGQAN